MNAIELGALLADPALSGVYFVDLRDRESLMESGNTLQYLVASADLKGCTDTDGVLDRIADALEFPSWFGVNWDALADCLNDLSWLAAEGYVLLIEHIGEWRDRDDGGFETLIDVLDEAAARWAEDRTPFWAFVLLPGHELERLSDETPPADDATSV